MKIIWYVREIVKNYISYNKGPLYTFFWYWKYQHLGRKVWSYLTPYKKTAKFKPEQSNASFSWN